MPLLAQECANCDGPGFNRRVLASTPYHPIAFVLDYITISGASDYTFSQGNTYFISGLGYFSGGTLTFQPGSILKLASGASVLQYGTLVCNGTSSNPSIITSKDDNLYGERILGSTGNPSYSGAPALWVYCDPSATTVSGMKIRWAQTAILFEATDGTVEDVNVEACQTGLLVQAGSSVTIVDSTKCGVQTPVDTGGGYYGTVQGSFTESCSGDADSDNLPDLWETTHFGNTTSENGSGDPDGDDVTNLQEYQGGSDPNDPWLITWGSSSVTPIRPGPAKHLGRFRQSR